MVSMGAKMVKQAITVHQGEPPLIATGHENIKDESPLAKLWEDDKPGEVVEKDEFKGYIKVKKADGKIEKIDIPTPIYAQKRTSIQFFGADVGTKLKKGDIVYRSLNLAKDGQLQLGINAYTAYMYWRGYDFEDSMTISESFSKRLTHLGEYPLYYDVKEGEEIKFIAEPGTVVSALTRDQLVTVERELTLNLAQEGLKNLVQETVTKKKLAGLLVPNNITEAIVADVKVIPVKKSAKSEEVIKKVIGKDYRKTTRPDGKAFLEKYANYPAREISITEKDSVEGEKNLAYRILIKLVIASPAKAGD